jgi:hypothetical protein
MPTANRGRRLRRLSPVTWYAAAYNARTARRLAGPIARLSLLRPLLAFCRIADFTGRGVGPTLDILGGAGGGDPMLTLRSSHRIRRQSPYPEFVPKVQISRPKGALTTVSKSISSPRSLKSHAFLRGGIDVRTRCDFWPATPAFGSSRLKITHAAAASGAVTRFGSLFDPLWFRSRCACVAARWPHTK